MDQHNQFLGPERGSGIMGWAIKQLVIWSFAGFAVYWVATANQLFTSSSGDAAPLATVARPDPAPAERPRPLAEAASVTDNSLTLHARPDGYAYVQAAVNGSDMVMAFDTGASFVALTHADAVKAGVAGNLNYSMSFTTANGRGLGAPVVLREVRIGQLAIENVNAVVMQNMQMSLLGQSFLSRLRSYQMENGTLTLTWQ